MRHGASVPFALRGGRTRIWRSAGGYAGAMIRSMLVALLVGGALVTGGLSAGEEPPERLPMLRLPTIDGELVATSDFRGGPLLLVEFASW